MNPTRRTFTIAAASVLIVAIPVALVVSFTAIQKNAVDEEPASRGPSPNNTIDDAQRIAILEDLGIPTFEQEIQAEDFEIANLAGGMTRLSDYRGSFVFLNFWATWCPPCREEMPAMQIMHESLASEAFAVVAASVQEPESTVASYIQQFGYSFPILLDTAGTASSRYGVRGIPSTYFISPSGRVLGVLVGIRDWAEPEMIAAMRRLSGGPASVSHAD